MKKIVIISALVSSVFMTGCATQIPGANQYNTATAGAMQQVMLGTVISTRPVVLKGSQMGIGGLAGAGIGGLLGSKVGSGKGSIVGAILGAVGGGVAGNAVESHLSKSDGVEITIKTDQGQIVAIAQAVDQNQIFRSNDRVKIIGSGNSYKVTKL